MIARLRLLLIVGAVCGALGFVAGRWSLRGQSIRVAVKARAEKDLSPSGEHRTVIAPRIRPGRPTPPPVRPPEAFGEHISTTRTELPALPEGSAIHTATYADLDGRTLELRNVQWIDTPEGRATIGETETTAQPFRLKLPPPPSWGVSALVPLGEGRPKPGLHVQWTPGPLIIGAGHVGGVTFAEIGGRW